MLTHSEEDPLKHFAIVIGIRRWVKPEDMVLVVMLRQIEQDRCSLENSEIATGMVDDSWDTAIRVQFDKPRFLQGH